MKLRISCKALEDICLSLSPCTVLLVNERSLFCKWVPVYMSPNVSSCMVGPVCIRTGVLFFMSLHVSAQVHPSIPGM